MLTRISQTQGVIRQARSIPAPLVGVLAEVCPNRFGGGCHGDAWGWVANRNPAGFPENEIRVNRAEEIRHARGVRIFQKAGFLVIKRLEDVTPLNELRGADCMSRVGSKEPEQ